MVLRSISRKLLYNNTICRMSTSAEEGKKQAAVLAINKYIQDGQDIGIGSGSTIVYAVERLAARVIAEKLRVRCVPTSFQARQLILQHGLPLADLETCPSLHVAVDGADEVDAQRSLIKGGGGCLLQEKVVAAAAQRFVVIADLSKRSQRLGDTWKRGVPIEVAPIACMPVQRTIEKQWGGQAVLRMAQSKAGPVVTDNGNFILDWKFDNSKDYDWSDMAVKLKMIPGVMETGLFVGMTHSVIFGGPKGAEEML